MRQKLSLAKMIFSPRLDALASPMNTPSACARKAAANHAAGTAEEGSDGALFTETTAQQSNFRRKHGGSAGDHAADFGGPARIRQFPARRDTRPSVAATARPRPRISFPT